MTSDFTAQVDDLALFFKKDDGTPGQVWVPHEVYTRANLKADKAKLPKGWDGAVAMRVPLEPNNPNSSVYYLANLGLLQPPGEMGSADASRPQKVQAVTAAAGNVAAANGAAGVAPGPGDIVVVPFSDPANAYVVPRSVYTQGPALDDPDTADLVFMAVQEGVVLANLPKGPNLQGLTCYLLNLLSFKS